MAPQKRMMLKADVNRIYDEEVYSEQKIKEEKFFVRPSRQRKMKKGKLFSVGMGLDLPFCIIILVLLTIGMIMMFSASYAYAYYNQGDSYSFPIEAGREPEGLSQVQEGDRVTVTYTGKLTVVDRFTGEVLSVQAAS